MKTVFLFLTLIFVSTVYAQNERAFIIYNSKGKKVSYKMMKKQLLKDEFVFFGEFHDNPISHWMELELVKAMFAKFGDSLQLGFEMFERDQQLLLNDYLSGVISEKQFEDSCRLWSNYKTDYKPLIQYAKIHQLACVASNIPRRDASLLFKKGREALDTLNSDEQSYMVPLNEFVVDTSLSQYAAIKEMEVHAGGMHMLEAQAIKDATMAFFIIQNMKPGSVMLHFNGAYHSDFYQGIIWYLMQRLPEAKVGTVSTVTQEDIRHLDKENRGKADFIICVPESMTRTM